MVSLMKGIYLSTLFKLKANKTISLHLGKHIRPMFKTIYNPSTNGLVQITRDNIFIEEKSLTMQEKENVHKEDTKGSDSSDVQLKKIFMPLHIYNTDYTFSQDSIYFFEYANNEEYEEIIDKFRNVIFGNKICAILIDQKTFNFIKEYMKYFPFGLDVNLKEVGEFWLQIVVPMLFLILAFGVYFTGKNVIRKFSKLDPVMADFNISASKLLKYRDVVDKSIIQCTICFEDFLNDDDVRMLACQHYYHSNCIDRWLIGHSRKCPCCRYSVEINEKP